jgi:N-acetylglucosaminyldiphosphoundecaprenol N-acetyl-beta-D-mannosaminyltransferase
MSTLRVNVLGVSVAAVELAGVLETIDRWRSQRTPSYVCVTPAHSIMACQQDKRLRKVFNSSGLTVPDGMSLVWLLRIRSRLKVERIYGPDLVLAVCEAGLSRGYRHFFVGGGPGVAEELVRQLRAKFVGVRIAGTLQLPFIRSSQVEQELTQVVRKSRPDILWVGLGSPKQELWMADHLEQLQVPVMIGVGAAFDFLSGRKPQAPRWMQRAGLEWLFRLASEPRRLWPRYRQYPFFALLVAAQLLGLRKFPLEGGEGTP